MIEIKHVSKKFQSKNITIVANDNISLTINGGQVYGVLGQNGSGKTTLINQMIGLYKIDEGDILISGKSIKKHPKLGRTKCSVQVQGQLSFGELTPRKIVTLMGEFKGGKVDEIKKETNRLFKTLAIEEWADKPGHSLSGGVKRLTAFCMAAICAKEYIILDEPTNDVDPVRRKYLWNEIKSLAKSGCCIVVVTHNILELENVVDTVAIINNGKLITEGKIADIKQHLNNQLKMELYLSHEDSEIILPDWVISSQRKKEMLIFNIDPDYTNAAIHWARDIVRKEIAQTFSLTETTLEDVYISLIEKGA